MDIRHMRLALWGYDGNTRARRVIEALFTGARRLGIVVTVTQSPDWRDYDMLAVYGVGNPRRLAAYRAFQAAGRHVVNVDLGYWRRDAAAEVRMYHRFSLNHPHPQAYVMTIPRPPDRFDALGLRVAQDHTRGQAILIAGTGEKSYQMLGIPDLSWDQEAATRLREHTKRIIYYRPKPSRRRPAYIKGTRPMAPDMTLERVLGSMHAIVTRHSNVAVDALLAGVPAFCVDGAARAICSDDFSLVDEARLPDPVIRRQFLHNLAYWQCSIAEMQEGYLWRTINDYLQVRPVDCTSGVASATSMGGSTSTSRPKPEVVSVRTS